MSSNLYIQAVSKTYPDGTQALRGIDLAIGAGVFGLLGPNGAGKSTLMRSVVGIQPPDVGTIEFDGRTVYPDSMEVRRRCGFLPQDFGIYPEVTSVEFLDHVARLRGFTDARQRKKAVHAVLGEVHLEQAIGQKVGGYSGGMRRRLGLAQALLGKPELLVVDEPTAGLDPEERFRIIALLKRSADQGAVVILSTHIVSDVEDLCKSMAVISGGRLCGVGAPQSLTSALTGQVWGAMGQSVQQLSQRSDIRLLSRRYLGGQEQVRVLATSCPGQGFLAQTPTLEDAYFSLLEQPQPIL
jgi:ABC-type multidrug transport system ATPase subunit